MVVYFLRMSGLPSEGALVRVARTLCTFNCLTLWHLISDTWSRHSLSLACHEKFVFTILYKITQHYCTHNASRDDRDTRVSSLCFVLVQRKEKVNDRRSMSVHAEWYGESLIRDEWIKLEKQSLCRFSLSGRLQVSLIQIPLKCSQDRSPVSLET